MNTQDKKAWAIEKAGNLKDRLDDLLKSSLVDPEKMKELTAHYRVSGIYHYSFLNSLLIFCQGGMLAHGFKRWQDLNRHVKKGEKARIYIFTPAFKRKEDAETGEKAEYLAYFLLRPVFDVSQTEGEPLEYVHNSPDTANYSFDELAAKVEALTGLPVVVKPTGRARGYCSPTEIAVNESSNNTDRIKTLFHEAAHALLDHARDTDLARSRKEVEAEAAAYLVLSFLGVDFELSREYVQAYGADSAQVDRMEIIKTADRLIKAVRIQPEGEREAA